MACVACVGALLLLTRGAHAGKAVLEDNRWYEDACLPDAAASDTLLQCELTDSFSAVQGKLYAFNGPLVRASDRMGAWGKAVSFFNPHDPPASAYLEVDLDGYGGLSLDHFSVGVWIRHNVGPRHVLGAVVEGQGAKAAATNGAYWSISCRNCGECPLDVRLMSARNGNVALVHPSHARTSAAGSLCGLAQNQPTIARGTRQFADGAWHHVLVAVDGRPLREKVVLYVDGRESGRAEGPLRYDMLTSTSTAQASPAAVAAGMPSGRSPEEVAQAAKGGTLRIGRGIAHSERWMDVSLADLRVFSRALGADEALALQDVDCVLSDWTPWGACVADPCGDLARNPPGQRGPRVPLEVYRYRTRAVVHAAAGAGGKACGALEEQESCGHFVECADPARRSQYPDAHGRAAVEKAKELEWILSKAAQGDAGAQYTLGTVYEHSKLGVARNHAKALEWYAKAAAQGNAMALEKIAPHTGL